MFRKTKYCIVTPVSQTEFFVGKDLKLTTNYVRFEAISWSNGEYVKTKYVPHGLVADIVEYPNWPTVYRAVQAIIEANNKAIAERTQQMQSAIKVVKAEQRKEKKTKKLGRPRRK